MNPEEQNGILNNLDFLHSEHGTYFEYNQEKLGSDIHASDVHHEDNLMMQSSMENVHHGSSASKLEDHFEMVNPHETFNSQYVDEPGCVPIESEPAQTAPPLPAPSLAHPVTAPLTTPSRANMTHIGAGPFNIPVGSSASTVQVQATVQLNMVYTKPITMGPLTEPFLVKRFESTNNLILIPPAGVLFKTVDSPMITEIAAMTQLSTSNNQQEPQIDVVNRKQGQRKTVSPVVLKGPEPKKARTISSIELGPNGAMNSRGTKNNPHFASAHVPPPIESSKRFDISRYQPVRAQANNFEEDEDEVTNEVTHNLGQNFSEPNSQWGVDEQIFLDLVPVPELELACCDDKIDHDDVHNQNLISDGEAPALDESEIFKIIDDLGDSHQQEKVPLKKIQMMLEATECQIIKYGKHEVKNKRFNKSNKGDSTPGPYECRICYAQGINRHFTKKDARMKHQRSHFWMVLNKPCNFCNELAERMDNHMDVCPKNPNAKKFKKTK